MTTRSPSETAIERFVAALRAAKCNPRRGDGGWSARCPSHDDHSPSLSFTYKGGKLLATCHAGCPVERVAAALNLSMVDLFDQDDQPKQAIRIAATYDYVDETGDLLYQVVRNDPKGFRQRRPDGRGGWVWSVNGTRRVLYELPRVQAAIAAGRPVFLTEGEKDADRLNELLVDGSCATTASGGAGKWRGEYAEQLAGATRVIIIADRDQAGRDHATQVAAGLRSGDRKVTIVEPVSGNDAADHLDAGFALTAFSPQVVIFPSGSVDTSGGTVPSETYRVLQPSTPPKGRFVAVSLGGLKRRRYEMLLADWQAPIGTVGVLCGQQGVGKGTILADVASDVSQQGHGVILLADEDSAQATHLPRLQAAEADLEHCHIIRAAPRDPKTGTYSEGLLLPNDAGDLERLAQETGARLVIIDPWTNHVAGFELDRGGIVRPALMALRHIADRCQLSVILAAHPTKNAGKGDPLDEIAHASAVSQVARWAYWATRDPDHPTSGARLVSHVKANLTAEGPTLRYTLQPVTLPASGGEPRVEIIRAVRGGTSPLSDRDIRDRLTHSPQAAETWLHEYLTTHGATQRPTVVEAATAAGHSQRSIDAAAANLCQSSPTRPAIWTLSS
jgi:5S rRNA maturation endonuclease (ribonuclease M5)